MSTRFGRYDLLRPLGKGGMAEVFLARYGGPEGFEKRLVIKRVLPRLSDDPGLLRMFFEEAKTQVSFSHGNLVSVFDFGRVGNDYFIAMEHVRGVDLGSLLAAAKGQGETLPASLVAFLGIELCRALGYVHRRGFVHRDVSPRNVLLSSDGEVKLSDFGLALSLQSGDRPGTRGTPSYMAPEQASGDRVDARADLYALGMVLAEALHGPVSRTSDAGSDGAAPPGPRGQQPRAIPEDGPLGPVLFRATRGAPDDRFSGADEMLGALEPELARAGVPRERIVRELAARVTALLPPDGEASDAPPARTATLPTAAGEGRGGDSYFRDHRSATFVDEMMRGRPSVPRGRPRVRLWTAIAIGVAIAGGLVVVRRVGVDRRGGDRTAELVAGPGPTARPDPAPVPRGTTTHVAPPSEHASGEPAAPPQLARPGAVKGAGPERAKRGDRAVPRGAAEIAAPGSLTIRCTPWCVPYLDGVQRGDDGRSFLLRDVAPGPHRVEGRRLEDRQERAIDVRSGHHDTVELRFE